MVLPYNNRMSKPKRTDKIKNLKKVWAVILKDPLKTDREIEKELGIWKSTVNRAKQELGHIGAKSKFVLEVLEKDKNIIMTGLDIIKKKLENKKEVKKMKVSEVSQVIKENTTRYSMFAWEMTDDEWWIKSLTDININIWS